MRFFPPILYIVLHNQQLKQKADIDVPLLSAALWTLLLMCTQRTFCTEKDTLYDIFHTIDGIGQIERINSICQHAGPDSVEERQNDQHQIRRDIEAGS